MCTRTALKRTLQPLGLLAVLAWGVAPAFAVHDLGIFELEKGVGAIRNDVATGDDWENVVGTGGDGGASDFSILVVETTDNVVGGGIFDGGSSKDDLDINKADGTPNWKAKAGGAVDKNDILAAFAATYTAQATNTNTVTEPGDVIAYFGANRFATNGSATIGFWFFQKTVAVNTATGTFVDQNGDPAVHSVDDLLILSDFTQGGVISTIKAYRWVGSGGDTNDTLDLIGTAGDCSTASADEMCATVNSALTTTFWTYQTKDKVQGQTRPFRVVSPGGHFEGGINLTALGLPECFSSFMATTRQSGSSVDAVIEDFALGPNFATCGQILAKECTATVQGDGKTVLVDIKVIVTNDGSAPITGLTVTDNKAVPQTLSGPSTLGGNETATFTGTYTTTAPPGAGYTNTATVTGTQGGQAFTATVTETNTPNPGCVPGLTKGLTVNKACTATLVNGTDVSVSFSGTITNTGTVQLSGLNITDNPPATFTSTPSSTLGPGGTASYSGTYLVTNATSLSASDTVTVTATGALGTGATGGDASASCAAAANPGLSVTKACTIDLVNLNNQVAVRVSFTGTVTNTGNVSLHNFQLTDAPPATFTSVPTGTLGPGGTASYSGTYVPNALPAGTSAAADTVTFTDFVKANASAVLGSPPTEATSNTASCPVCVAN